MKRETYEKVIRFFERSRWRSMILELVCKILPVLCGTVYLFIGVGLLFLKYEHLARYVAVPAAGVVIVTILRKLINRRRPYEALGFSPFLKYRRKRTKFSKPTYSLCVFDRVRLLVYFCSPGNCNVCACSHHRTVPSAFRHALSVRCDFGIFSQPYHCSIRLLCGIIHI